VANAIIIRGYNILYKDLGILTHLERRICFFYLSRLSKMTKSVHCALYTVHCKMYIVYSLGTVIKKTGKRNGKYP